MVPEEQVLPRLPIIVGTAVFLLSAVAQPSDIPNYLGLRFSQPWQITIAIVLAFLSAVAAGLSVNRIWPVATMAAVGWLVGAIWPATAVTAFCIGARCSRRAQIAFCVLTVVAMGVPAYLGVLKYEGYGAWAAYSAIMFLGIVVVFPLVLGTVYRKRTQHMATLSRRATVAELERELADVRARSSERAAIAREMHDIVGNRVTLITLHSGALELRAPDEPTRAAAAQIRMLGRQAMAELRQMLGVLRLAQPALDHLPSPIDVDHLVEQTAAAGLPVTLTREGTPPELPETVEMAVFRVVQEGLTNVAKHAGRPRTSVRISYTADDVEVCVENEPPVGEPLPLPTSGHGLTGLAERIAGLDGTMTGGATEAGGWRLEVRIPVGCDGEDDLPG